MLDFSGYAEQDFPYKCPECGTELIIKDCVGIGEYPQGGYRSMMKPGHTLALGFECPNCFIKSCFHATQREIKLWEDYKFLHDA